jgi:ankyrin repeat protein
MDAQTPLQIAACQDSFYVARELIHYMQLQNKSLDDVDRWQETPLILAIKNFSRRGLRYVRFDPPETNSSVAMLLILGGADVRKVDGQGCTPLHWAAQRGMTTVMKKLLEIQGCEGKHLNFSRELICKIQSQFQKLHSNINQPNERGLTPLHYAAIFVKPV